ncbi:MAG TPA: hypothetical protein P5081_08360 [Phycisphaerae bacterium]|nr:hypothetical protein [Phycisphaerales bacterium]HPF38731.1 hypothetical protein [Phycisphaerae bacterium]HRW52885.1 hypothetical protein [Phycisphaerae bacterium]
MQAFEFKVDVAARKRAKQRRRDSSRDLPPLQRLLILAHQIEEALAEGRASSLADAALQLGVSQARLSQIRRFTRLIPEIQEQILFGDPPEILKLSERDFLDVLLAWAPENQRLHLSRILGSTE